MLLARAQVSGLPEYQPGVRCVRQRQIVYMAVMMGLLQGLLEPSIERQVEGTVINTAESNKIYA